MASKLLTVWTEARPKAILTMELTISRNDKGLRDHRSNITDGSGGKVKKRFEDS